MGLVTRSKDGGERELVTGVKMVVRAKMVTSVYYYQKPTLALKDETSLH